MNTNSTVFYGESKRRQFLKTSALAGGGVMMAPAFLHAQGANERLNLAFIGIGGRGESNLNSLRHQNVVALCDVDDERAGDAYTRFPNARTFYDYRNMLDEMHAEIDGVVVSTPDHTHFHPSMAALDLGKHLYCEKPMAHAVAEIRTMTERANDQGVATQLGVQRHTIPNVHRVVELIQSGAIGHVTEVYCRKGGDRGMPEIPQEFPAVPDHLKWDLWLGPAMWRDYSPAYCPYNWRFWWDYGTGETGNWGCHILDIPYWALDLGFPTRVDASGPPVDPERTPKEMYSTFVFPQKGNRPEVTLHWDHTNKPFPYRETYVMPNWGNTLFVGEKVALLCDFGKHVLLPESDFTDFVAPDPSIPDSPGFFEEWIIACKGGETATCDFAYSGPLSETVLLGNTAYRAQQNFDWDAKTMTAKGADAVEPFLRPTYRSGWSV